MLTLIKGGQTAEPITAESKMQKKVQEITGELMATLEAHPDEDHQALVMGFLIRRIATLELRFQ